LGLWGDPNYAAKEADNPTAVLAARGRFTIVEGKVVSVRESGGTIYVNFGRRWSEDFTVTISKRNERSFAESGLVPKSLAGRRVRVRGVIEERGGPWIEAVAPGQIEIADR
ncbi:MAG: thermonuclease family protein, partial [Xanthobacteraceae bacterium]